MRFCVGWVCVALAACGGSVAKVSGDAGGGGGNEGGGVSEGGGVTPGGPNLPPDPGGPTPDGTGSVVLAVHQVFLGDTDRNFVQSNDAWKTYGLNLDGLVTSPVDTNVCMPSMGGYKGNVQQTDGITGIDNSWGHDIIPLIMSFDMTPSKTASDQVNAGGPTTLFRIDNLGSGASYSPLPGMGYRSTPAAGPLTWSGGDTRDVDGLSLRGGDLQMPLMAFAKGYMNGRVFVGVPPTNAVLLEVFLQDMGVLPPQATGVIVETTIDPSNTSATDGLIAGAFPTTEVLNWVHTIAGRLDKSFCGGSAFASIATEISQASDILVAPDGTVGNSVGMICNAISFGFGFNATAVKLGSVVTVPVAPNPCQ